MSYPDFLLDKRVLDRNMAKGLLDNKAIEKHHASLPDVADNAERCSPPAAEGSSAEAEAETGDEG